MKRTKHLTPTPCPCCPRAQSWKIFETAKAAKRATGRTVEREAQGGRLEGMMEGRMEGRMERRHQEGRGAAVVSSYTPHSR